MSMRTWSKAQRVFSHMSTARDEITLTQTNCPPSPLDLMAYIGSRKLDDKCFNVNRERKRSAPIDVSRWGHHLP